MRVTTRFAAVALWACFLAVLPSYADDSPSAHLEGYRCEVWWNNSTAPGMSDSLLILCQIGEDSEPFTANIVWPAQSITPTLDALLNLLAILDNARQNPPPLQHEPIEATTPTP